MDENLTDAIVMNLVARKDKTQMTIAKLAFAPGLFNINEPLMFGLPIVMNPIYAIPFIALQHHRLSVHHRVPDHPARHPGCGLDHPRLPDSLPGFGRT